LALVLVLGLVWVLFLAAVTSCLVRFSLR